ncbi:AAA family ATPase [Brachyspira intermedia]|uniref:AAA family ATPase n=1 Tax=Brachyspira intermedia TaxID=84377 RepID=UPI003007A921
MYVENVRIKNFTVFKDCYTDFSKGVNIFIGENGTGKTHLLKAIYCLDSNIYTDNEEYGEYYYFSLMNQFPLNSGLLLNNKHDINNLWKIIFNNDLYLHCNTPPQIENNDYLLKHSNKIVNLYVLDILNNYPFPFNKKFAYIPCKDILTNSKGFISLYNKREVSFESVYYDILNKAFVPQLRELDLYLEDITKKIENAIGGIVIQKDEVFFIKYKDFGEVQFTMVAEGHKKLALLWLLIKNGEIDKDTILLFDEPESNLNPKLTRVLVEILLSLSRLGVQIFLATHNNFIIEDFELQRKENDKIKFHSFYFDEDKNNGVLIESSEYLNNIHHNSIEDKFEEQHLQSIEKAFKN